MFGHQAVSRPVIRKPAAVCNIQLILIHANLDRNAALILLVAQGIEKGFTQGGIGNKVTLNTLHPFIGDFRLHIFQVYDLNDLVDLFQQGTVDFILITEIGIVFKESDFCVRTQLPAVRVFAKQQHCSIGVIPGVGQAQLFH